MDTRIVYFLLLSCASVFAQDAETPCQGEQIKDANGDCVDPIISRNIYVFAEPEKDEEEKDSEGPELPKPKLEYNIVFVRAPERGEGSDPIVVPPPQQKTIVYVLSKKGEDSEPKIIEVPAGPKNKPEVYYVNYAEGENPELPGGVDLQTALDTAATETGGPGTAGTSATDPTTSGTGTPTDPTGYAPPAAPAPQAPAAPTGYAPPAAPAPPAPAAPTGYAPPAAPAPPAPAAPQQPQYVYVQPQPQQQYIQPQQQYFAPQQGGIGNFQPLGFPQQG